MRFLATVGWPTIHWLKAWPDDAYPVFRLPAQVLIPPLLRLIHPKGFHRVLTLTPRAPAFFRCLCSHRDLFHFLPPDVLIDNYVGDTKGETGGIFPTDLSGTDKHYSHPLKVLRLHAMARPSAPP